MPDVAQTGRTSTISRTERREELLQTLREEVCVHTTLLAYIVARPLSTVRRDLEWMEAEGFVRGVKQDERNISEIGRVRIYWSLTREGVAYLDDTKGQR